MSAQVVGLRVASVLFGLACLAYVARLLGLLRGYRVFRGWYVVHPGYHHVGYFPVLVAIALTGILSVWLWSLSSTPPKAGPPPGS